VWPVTACKISHVEHLGNRLRRWIHTTRWLHCGNRQVREHTSPRELYSHTFHILSRTGQRLSQQTQLHSRTLLLLTISNSGANWKPYAGQNWPVSQGLRDVGLELAIRLTWRQSWTILKSMFWDNNWDQHKLTRWYDIYFICIVNKQSNNINNSTLVFFWCLMT